MIVNNMAVAAGSVNVQYQWVVAQSRCGVPVWIIQYCSRIALAPQDYQLSWILQHFPI